MLIHRDQFFISYRFSSYYGHRKNSSILIAFPIFPIRKIRSNKY